MFYGLGILDIMFGTVDSQQKGSVSLPKAALINSLNNFGHALLHQNINSIAERHSQSINRRRLPSAQKKKFLNQDKENK